MGMHRPAARSRRNLAQDRGVRPRQTRRRPRPCGRPVGPADGALQPTGSGPLRVRCGYEAVANVGYAPIEPVDLLVRASTALRTGRAEGANWLRRFDDGATATPS